MDAIMPYSKSLTEDLASYGREIGFELIAAVKFDYMMKKSDLDVFELMYQERLHSLLYGWEVCEPYLTMSNNISYIPPNVIKALETLTYHSLHIWFSKEWDNASKPSKVALIYSLKQAKPLLKTIPSICGINWEYLLSLDITPWNAEYIQKNIDFGTTEPTNAHILKETMEPLVSAEDLAFITQEGLHVILLRLIKLIDRRSLAAVEKLAMRAIATWIHMKHANHLQPTPHDPHRKDARQLIDICHLYLMSKYERDDKGGLGIDYTIKSIRIYYNLIRDDELQEIYKCECFYTPAQYIAMVVKHLNLTCSEFFEAFALSAFHRIPTTLFGVISQAFVAYLLENVLVEMNGMSTEDFIQNINHYQELIDAYIVEREHSEKILKTEMHKKQMQINSGRNVRTVKFLTNFENKICKGNRRKESKVLKTVDDLIKYSDVKRVDNVSKLPPCEPVFEKVHNDEHLLNYIYNALIPREYKGWRLSKLNILVKIITNKMNIIETWHYHPGLTAEFLINLDVELSQYYVDLAKLFEDQYFIHQEIWLTAFFLNPCKQFYEKIIRCGALYNKLRRNQPKKGESKILNNPPKLGLLSSIAEVHNLISLSNFDALNGDYEPLRNILHTLVLPKEILRDLITVIFLPRSMEIVWALSWDELRNRCKKLFKNPAEKKRFVEMHMVEASEKLRYLKIDYNKYKNRPQMNYGTIEQGYEANLQMDDSEEKDYWATMGDDDDDEDEDKKSSSDSDDDFAEVYFANSRRTRARTAAAKLKAKEVTVQMKVHGPENSLVFTNSTEYFIPIINIWDGNQQNELITQRSRDEFTDKIEALRKFREEISMLSKNPPLNSPEQNAVSGLQNKTEALNNCASNDQASTSNDATTNCRNEVNNLPQTNDDNPSPSNAVGDCLKTTNAYAKKTKMKISNYRYESLRRRILKRRIKCKSSYFRRCRDKKIQVVESVESDQCLLQTPKDSDAECDNVKKKPQSPANIEEVPVLSTQVDANTSNQQQSCESAVTVQLMKVETCTQDDFSDDQSIQTTNGTADCKQETHNFPPNDDHNPSATDSIANCSRTISLGAENTNTNISNENHRNLRPRILKPSTIKCAPDDFKSVKTNKKSQVESGLLQLNASKDSGAECDNVKKKLRSQTSQGRLKSPTPVPISTEEKMKLCRPFKVMIRRLCNTDWKQLRQPRVVLKRLNLEKYFQTTEQRKRALLTADNSSDIATGKPGAMNTRRIKRKSKRLSCYSYDTDSSSAIAKYARPRRRRKALQRNAKGSDRQPVKENNKSDLNVCIPTLADNEPRVVRATFNPTFIQISSFSSSDVDETEESEYAAIEYPMDEVMEHDPLFDEEYIIPME